MASEGVLRHVHPLGDSPRRCLADGGACVPKVLPAAELEGILAGLIVAVPLEPAGGAAVSNDVEEPQELPVEPPAGGDDAGEEGIPDFSVAGPDERLTVSLKTTNIREAVFSSVFRSRVVPCCSASGMPPQTIWAST